MQRSFGKQESLKKFQYKKRPKKKQSILQRDKPIFRRTRKKLRFYKVVRLENVTLDLFIANLPFFIFGGQFIGFEKHTLELYFVVKQIVFIQCILSSFFLRYKFHYRRFGFQYKYTFQHQNRPHTMRHFLKIYGKWNIINQFCYYSSYFIIACFQFLMFGIPYFFYTDIGFIFTQLYGMYSTGHVLRILSIENIAQPFLDALQHCYRWDFGENEYVGSSEYRVIIDHVEAFIFFIQTFYFTGILLHYHLGRSMYAINQIVHHQPTRRF